MLGGPRANKARGDQARIARSEQTEGSTPQGARLYEAMPHSRIASIWPFWWAASAPSHDVQLSWALGNGECSGSNSKLL